MPRKKSAVPKQKAPKLLTVAAHLPDDPQELYPHCMASWTGILKDTVHFATPYPPGPQVTQDLANLNTALQNAEGGDTAAMTALKAAASKVRQDWHLLAKYAEATLRAGAIEDAPAVLANILMYPSNVGQRKPKPPLEIKQPTTWPSGSVHAIALAVAATLTYYFEFSLDQVTWSVFQTGKSQATLTGLTPGKTYWFRFRAFVRGDTMTAYSTSVDFLVR